MVGGLSTTHKKLRNEYTLICKTVGGLCATYHTNMDLHSTYKEKKKYTYIMVLHCHTIYNNHTQTPGKRVVSYNGGAAAGKGKDMN